MDVEQQEMQFLGLFGIYRQAYNIIFSLRKIFIRITVTLIFPLCFMFLSQIKISDLLSSKITYFEMELNKTQSGTPEYDHLSDILSSEWRGFLFIKFLSFIDLLLFFLLSNSAVIYTVTCAYTAREQLTYKKVMSVVPKVWKRLMVTLLCIFVAILLYTIGLILTLSLWGFTVGQTAADAPILLIILVLYLGGFVYMILVWQLASVISVLEDKYGVEAILKSKELFLFLVSFCKDN